MSTKTYIVAVSGGVDSVVLLHKLIARKNASTVQPLNPSTFIVAHFDHGVRSDSARDAEFVKELAADHGLKFEIGHGKLGSGASEEVARNTRYAFLRRVQRKYEATAIITAHHQDDVLETMIMNMLRGTSPRGLVGFSQPDIMRPLLNIPKAALLEYAKTHALTWREDSTNTDTAYLRNYIRLKLLPKLKAADRATLLDIRAHVSELMHEIDSLSAKFLVQLSDGGAVVRARFVPLPFVVQKQIMAYYLRAAGVLINADMVERATVAVKTLLPGKHIELQKNVALHSRQNSVFLNVDVHGV